MIDHEKRSHYLLGRIEVLHAQAKWEAENFSLVKCAPALERILATLDGDDAADIRRRLTTVNLLIRAHQVLSLERRQERLALKKAIAEFLNTIDSDRKETA